MVQPVNHRLLAAEARLDPRTVQVGFMTDKVALAKGSLWTVPFSLSPSFNQSTVHADAI